MSIVDFLIGVYVGGFIVVGRSLLTERGPVIGKVLFAMIWPVAFFVPDDPD